jgi:hypothetical protein
MRCDQSFGLTEAAINLLYEEGYQTITIYRADGTQVDSGTTRCRVNRGTARVYAHYHGMFDDEYPLSEHTLPDGTVYIEALQAEPWSSGPCFFIALKTADGKWVEESLWDEETIRNA